MRSVTFRYSFHLGYGMSQQGARRQQVAARVSNGTATVPRSADELVHNLCKEIRRPVFVSFLAGVDFGHLPPDAVAVDEDRNLESHYALVGKIGDVLRVMQVGDVV